MQCIVPADQPASQQLQLEQSPGTSSTHVVYAHPAVGLSAAPIRTHFDAVDSSDHTCLWCCPRPKASMWTHAAQRLGVGPAASAVPMCWDLITLLWRVAQSASPVVCAVCDRCPRKAPRTPPRTPSPHHGAHVALTSQCHGHVRPPSCLSHACTASPRFSRGAHKPVSWARAPPSMPERPPPSCLSHT